MVTHYIFLSSNYTDGKRIALDYIVFNESEQKNIENTLNRIFNECGEDVSMSTHCIQTDSQDWESVINKDHFFRDVEIIKSVDEFIKLINRDRVLFGLDVAKYILSRIKCAHLKLEKLVYLCYADYLCKYDKKLFTDKIYAYKYGPVVETVYEKYKVYGYNEIRKDDKDIVSTNIYELPSKSRILFAEDGVKKIGSIEKTLKQYGNLTASELVDITHRKGTPWDISGRGENSNTVISDIAIKKCHCNEVI